MKTIESSSRTALVRSLPCLLLGSLEMGCNARLDISDETRADAGVGGTGGTGQTNPPFVHVDAGTPTGGCADGIRSKSESDIDCGGEACAACPSGARCERHTDCQSGACLAGACAASSCDDGIRNGEETGIDCGGGCQRCRSSTCDCASSPELTPLECDETEGYLVQCGQRGLLSADGETFVFAMCYMEREDAGATSGYELFRRRPDGTTEALGDGGALGLSTDGQRLLIYEDSAVSIVNAAGAVTPVPIPQLENDVRITGDGVTVFGGVANGTGGRRLARWTESAGLETLEDFPLLREASSWELGAVSHDGGIIAGSAYVGTRTAPFRWTAAGGLEELGTLPDDAAGAQPTAISSDGTTIAGFTLTSGSGRGIFRWTVQGQLEVMGSAPPVSYLPDAALFLSADGTTLAGTDLNGPARVVVWGPSGTEVANAELGVVTDMTPDGSVLVGLTTGSAGFMWQPPAGQPNAPSSAYDVTRLETLVAQTGADITGWALETITNISDDGRIIYGSGTCGGVPTYFRMQLRP